MHARGLKAAVRTAALNLRQRREHEPLSAVHENSLGATWRRKQRLSEQAEGTLRAGITLRTEGQS